MRIWIPRYHLQIWYNFEPKAYTVMHNIGQWTDKKAQCRAHSEHGKHLARIVHCHCFNFKPLWETLDPPYWVDLINIKALKRQQSVFWHIDSQIPSSLSSKKVPGCPAGPRVTPIYLALTTASKNKTDKALNFSIAPTPPKRHPPPTFQSDKL
jgi:hypothetical protein